MAVIIHPPSDLCMNGDCPSVVPLKKETQQKAVVYTQDIGVQPAWYICTCILSKYVHKLII